MLSILPVIFFWRATYFPKIKTLHNSIFKYTPSFNSSLLSVSIYFAVKIPIIRFKLELELGILSSINTDFFCNWIAVSGLKYSICPVLPKILQMVFADTSYFI